MRFHCEVMESSVAPSILTLSETGMTVPATLTDLRPDRDFAGECYKLLTVGGNVDYIHCRHLYSAARPSRRNRFAARRSYASAVLGVVIVCLSVSLSHTCFVANPKNVPAIFLYHMKGQSF